MQRPRVCPRGGAGAAVSYRAGALVVLLGGGEANGDAMARCGAVGGAEAEVPSLSEGGHLRQHLAMIHGGLWYVCDECGVLMTTQSNLHVHKSTVHAGRLRRMRRAVRETERSPAARGWGTSWRASPCVLRVLLELHGERQPLPARQDRSPRPPRLCMRQVRRIVWRAKPSPTTHPIDPSETP
jgi:hypothetical protein